MNEARKKWLHAYRFARLEVKREESEKKAMADKNQAMADKLYGSSPGTVMLDDVGALNKMIYDFGTFGSGEVMIGTSTGVMTATEAKQRQDIKAEGVAFNAQQKFINDVVVDALARMVSPPVVMSSGRNKKAADSWMVQFGPAPDPPPAPGEIIVKNNQGGYSRVPLTWFKITEV